MFPHSARMKEVMINLLPPFAKLIFDPVTAQESCRPAGNDGAIMFHPSQEPRCFVCFFAPWSDPRGGGEVAQPPWASPPSPLGRWAPLAPQPPWSWPGTGGPNVFSSSEGKSALSSGPGSTSPRSLLFAFVTGLLRCISHIRSGSHCWCTMH